LKYALVLLIFFFSFPAHAQIEGQMEWSGGVYSYWNGSYWQQIGYGSKGDGCSKDGELKYEDELYHACSEGNWMPLCVDTGGRSPGGCSTPGTIEFINNVYHVCVLPFFMPAEYYPFSESGC
jgi:hypothetical protein